MENPVDPPNPVIPNEVALIDPNDELFLHHSDHPSYVLSTRLLDGKNYGHWRRSVEVSLDAKNKLGFVTSACVKPTTDPFRIRQWERCNSMVISWLVHSVDKDIAESILYSRSASRIWRDLASRFGSSNRTRIYQVQKDISMIEQGSLDIATYYTKFKRIWDEYALLLENRACECGSNLAVMKLIQDQQVIQFLMGLNESFNVVRGNILMMSPPPNIDESYQFLVQEEQQRGMSKSSTIKEGENAAFASQQFKPTSGSFKKPSYCDHCKVTGHTIEKCWKIIGYPTSPASGAYCDHCKVGGHSTEKCWKLHGYPSNTTPSNTTGSRPYCDHCKAMGHVIDKCWKLHGYPPGMPSNNSTKGKKIAATTTGSSSDAIIQAQYQQLLSILQKHEIQDSTALLAGPFDEEAIGDWK